MSNRLYIDTLTEAEIERIEALMRPGRLSDDGFLGLDESLRDVIREDTETLKILGVTHEQVADRLEKLVLSVSKGIISAEELVRRMRPSSGFYTVELATLGHQDCPFEPVPNFQPYSNSNYFVINPADQHFTFGGLLIHLIRQHQFFEGSGTPYRLDPKQVVEFLQIQKTISS